MEVLKNELKRIAIIEDPHVAKEEVKKLNEIVNEGNKLRKIKRKNHYDIYKVEVFYDRERGRASERNIGSTLGSLSFDVYNKERKSIDYFMNIGDIKGLEPYLM